ncbi:cbb3-type cytochrome c oxidase subunit 3 [Paragemmobacter ruber]|uniref:CcoQ/FixQ family Cbb3-type cytochrome c oxidase assembly chaperone n=1 Tax=Paragemmobacter ruber TaxID=1985673 RepID=A0ABW9Y313_9RHOB|nr:cbb3-type cytochrome c oxidase subunit 3 [Rhodobacter ruber]NBE06913.1 CcoQ/FixQ family Cbb3-type cytochrome c oxidase assembly chaperone [Rhodobacter ruber]
METYSFLREFADSWALVALTLIFLGVVVWAFRPGSRPLHDAAAASIFRHEMKPADAGRDAPAPSEREA